MPESLSTVTAPSTPSTPAVSTPATQTPSSTPAATDPGGSSPGTGGESTPSSKFKFDLGDGGPATEIDFSEGEETPGTGESSEFKFADLDAIKDSNPDLYKTLKAELSKTQRFGKFGLKSPEDYKAQSDRIARLSGGKGLDGLEQTMTQMARELQGFRTGDVTTWAKEAPEEFGIAASKIADQWADADPRGYVGHVAKADGTSASVVLAHAFFEAGLKQLEIDPNVRRVTQAIRATAEAAAEYVKAIAQQVSGSMIDHVATISVNNDPILGKYVADAVRASGAHGVVSVEDSPTSETSIERQEGMQFAKGWRSQGFVNVPEKQICELENPFVYMLDRRLTSLQGLQPMLKDIEKKGRPLLILAEDVDGEALATLLTFKLQGTFAVCCVKLPENLGHRKDILLDIAAMCGGNPMLRELGQNPADAKPADLGSCRKVIVSRDNTRIIGGNGTKQAVNARVTEIRGLLASNPPQIEKERLHERLAKLTGGVTVLRLGAQTGLELGDKKMRVDDAVCAIKCALEEGVVPGAGMALARAAASLPDSWVRPVLGCPAVQILLNASIDAGSILTRTALNADPWFGYNVVTEQFGDLREAGVLDPVKVVRSSLLNAASVAIQMLLTETVVTLDRSN